MPLNPGEPLIDDGTPLTPLLDPVIDGEPKGRGLEPRDYSVHPVEMFAPPSGIALIPRSEWSERIRDMERGQSRLSDLYTTAGWPHLDQGRSNYCWSHSTGHCVMLTRLVNNQPHVPLSAFAVAAILQRGRNQGGWCGFSGKFLREVGIPSQRLWPQGSFDTRLDTPALREDAARHRVSEDWFDITRPVHGQAMTFDQVMSCLLARIPVALDYMWWRHSVCGLDPVEVEPGSFGIRILNSWRGWGERGMGVLRGNRAVPDGAIATRVVSGSA